MKTILHITLLAAAMTLTAGAQAQSGNAPTAEQPQGKPVAAFHMRTSVIPRAGDEMPLQQGLELYISSMAGGMTIVRYGVEGGKIVWAVTSGAVDDKTRKAIVKAVGKLQKRL